MAVVGIACGGCSEISKVEDPREGVIPFMCPCCGVRLAGKLPRAFVHITFAFERGIEVDGHIEWFGDWPEGERAAMEVRLAA